MFDRALEFVMQQECPGGNRRKSYVDDPDDRGGATNQGITQAVYDAWQKEHGLPSKPVRHITDREVDAIYKRNYWEGGLCYLLPDLVALAHFDACVNHGVGRACKLLQASVGAKQDGIIGPVTLGTVNALEANLVVLRYIVERMWFYRQIAKNDSSQTKFLVGPWLLRLHNLYEEVTGD